MKRIGITGPTGAGKTTALNPLAELGVLTLDTDALYHNLLTTCVPLQEELVAQFGDIQDESGQIDRKKLGNVVFADPEALTILNGITHGYISEAIDEAVELATMEGCTGVAIDAIALVESGLADTCDAVVAILAPAEVRIPRIMAREGIDRAYAEKRVAAQQPDSFYRTHATHVLDYQANETIKAYIQRSKELFLTILL